MIKKIIHYVWVGKSEIPAKVQENIKNNSKILGPSWKYKIWTEKDFDIESNPYTKYWYAKKQWAFVSDYLRAYAVYKEGGFYFDIDIILQKDISMLTKYDYVASRTEVCFNTMSIFGSIEKNPLLLEYLNITSHPKMISKPPRIMSTHIHSFVLNKYIDIPNLNEDFIFKKYAILKEDKLQLDCKNGENIAIHEHYDNWKNKKRDLKKSKYYFKKIQKFNEINDSKILKTISQRNKIFKKIQKLIS